MQRRGVCGTYLALGRQASCIIQEGSPDEMLGWHAGFLGLVNFTTPRVSLHEVSKAVSLSPMDLVLKPTHLPPASGKCSVCKRKQVLIQNTGASHGSCSKKSEWIDKLKAGTRHVLGPSLLATGRATAWVGREGGLGSGLGPRGLCEVVSSPYLGLMNSHKIGESQVGGGEVREGGPALPSMGATHHLAGLRGL